MADLIDKEAAKELIRATEVAFNTRVKSPIKAKFAEEIARLLDTLPAVDAVEVVRCKDCKYYGDEYFCPLRSLADYTDPDDYCSMGERREENAAD